MGLPFTYRQWRDLHRPLEVERKYTLASLSCGCRVLVRKRWHYDQQAHQWRYHHQRAEGCERRHSFVLAVVWEWIRHRNDEARAEADAGVDRS